MSETLTPEIRERLDLYDDTGSVVSQRDVQAALATIDQQGAALEDVARNLTAVLDLVELDPEVFTQSRMRELRESAEVPTGFIHRWGKLLITAARKAGAKDMRSRAAKAAWQNDDMRTEADILALLLSGDE